MKGENHYYNDYKNMNNAVVFQNTVQKNIFAYEILCKKNQEENEVLFTHVAELVNELIEFKDNYIYKNDSNNRWYGIETINNNVDGIEIVFISCKFKYQPNLIDVNSRIERPSPKSPDEGDKEKTHMLIKGNQIVFESKRNGTNISICQKLFNMAWNKIKNNVNESIKKVIIKQIVDTNFMDIIRAANKIKKVKLNVKSALLGTEFYNYQNDTGVEDTFNIEIKAKKRNELSKINVIDCIERFLSNNETVKKITMDINDEDDNNRVINTEEFAKKFNLFVEKNNNGEVISEDIFSKMRGLL